MIKEINYFTDPEIIKQYQNSDYEDERHYAVSRYLCATGFVTKSCDEFKFRLMMGLLNTIASSQKTRDEQGVTLDFEQLHLEYTKMIFLVWGDIVLSEINLPEDIVKVTYETAKTAEYVVRLFLGM